VVHWVFNLLILVKLLTITSLFKLTFYNNIIGNVTDTKMYVTFILTNVDDTIIENT